MAVIRIWRPKRDWSVRPATVLPAALILRPFNLHFNFTVILDGDAIGKIGNEQVKLFNVEVGEHHLHVVFLGVRKSREIAMSLRQGEERDFLCSSNGIGWPILRDATGDESAEMRASSDG